MNKLNNLNSILKQYLYDTFCLNSFEIDVIDKSNVILTDTNNDKMKLSNNFNEITLCYDNIEEKILYKRCVDDSYYWVIISKNEIDREKDFCQLL